MLLKAAKPNAPTITDFTWQNSQFCYSLGVKARLQGDGLQPELVEI